MPAQVHRAPRRFAALALALVLVAATLGLMADRVAAASSAGCDGGGYSLVLPGGTTVRGDQKATVPAAELGSSFLV